MTIEIKINDNEIVVEKIVATKIHECEGEDHDVKIGDVAMIDDADVIMCEDHFWKMIKAL